MKKIISVRIDNSILDIVDTVSIERNQSRSQLIEDAVRKSLIESGHQISECRDKHRAPKAGQIENFEATKPWLNEGISRSTWFRKRKKK